MTRVRAVTLAQVAEAAGLSTASASRALNNDSRVTEKTRRRIRQAAEALGYVPDGVARALASRRTRAIGAVVPALENPSFAKYVEALQQSLAEAGYILLLSSFNYDPLRELAEVRGLVERGVDGLVLVGADQVPEIHDLLAARRVPYVNTWSHDNRQGHPSVGFDNGAAAAALCHHLLDLGHRDIGVIAGLTRHNDRARARLEGIRRALKGRGLTLPRESLIERPYRIAEGQAALRQLMAAPNPPSAVFCGNDTLAFGALTAARDLGLRVPDDLSVTGFDDFDFARYLDPPLTTVRVPLADMGCRAGRTLLAAIESGQAPASIDVGFELVVRESTAAPNSRTAA